MSLRITQLFSLLVVLVFSAASVSAQSWIIEETYGGPMDDQAFNLISHANGNVTHIGYTNSFGAPGTAPNAHIVLSNSLGAPIVEYVYDIQIATQLTSPVVEPEMSIFECANGDYVWTSGAHPIPGNPADIVVMRITPFGAILWTAYLGAGNGFNDFSTSIIEANNGDIYITGYTDAIPSAGGYDAIVAAFGPGGVLLWSNKYGGGGTDFGRCIREMSTGDFVIAGETTSFNPSWDGLQFSVSPLGALLWTGAYGTVNDPEGFSTVVENTNGDLYTCGIARTGANADVFVVRSTVAGGAFLQGARYSAAATGQEGAWFINTSGTPGNLVMTGEVPGIIGGPSDGFFIEIGPNLPGIINYRVYGTGTNDELRSIAYSAGAAAPFTLGGYWMVGWTNGSGAGFDDHYLLRTNLVGKTGCDQIVLNSQVNAAGYSNVLGTVNSYSTATYNNVNQSNIQSILPMCPGQYVAPNAIKSGVEPVPGFSSEPLILSAEVLPQPVQVGGLLLLNAKLDRAATVQILISDMQGRQIFSGAYNALAGENQFKLNSADLHSGAYVVQISGLGQSQSLPLMMID